MKEIRTQDPFSIYRYDLLTDTAVDERMASGKNNQMRP